LENKDFNEKIDMFALGVCTYYMAFTCFPYKSIEKKTDSGKYNYVLDLSNLEELLKEKKKNAAF